MQNSKCSGLIGLLLGHRFEPRYTTIVKPQDTSKAIAAIRETHDRLVARITDAASARNTLAQMNDAIVEVSEQVSDNQYVKDVCVHCGAEIVNQDRPNRRLDEEL